MQKILEAKHTLWLEILFGAFTLPCEQKERLLDFAMIEYRHLKWIAKEIVRSGEDFEWRRETPKIEFIDTKDLLEYLSAKLMTMSYPEGALFDRIRSDEEYMSFMLQKLAKEPSHPITAFSKALRYEGLDAKSLQALVQFLFEEIYKEYELILIYTYAQLHTQKAQLGLIFEDLIYESIYHLKSFATLAARLGILFVPREVMREVYKFEDLELFLQEGIEEEMAAKEQCRALSQAIQNEELRKFFDFIDKQESYHIELMREALEVTKR